MTRSSCVSLARCERKPKESHHPARPRRARQAMVLETAQESSRDGIPPGPRTPANIDVKTRKIERHLARSTHVLADTSSPRSTSLNRRVRSQSFLRKRRPQVTEILAARQDLVGLDDGITGLKETRTALLQLHPVEHKLHDQGVPVLRHKLTCRTRRKRLRGTVKVAERDTAIFEGKGWEERVGETVLRDQSLSNDPKNFCPDFTNRMNSPVPRFVECLVRGRIDGIIL